MIANDIINDLQSKIRDSVNDRVYTIVAMINGELQSIKNELALDLYASKLSSGEYTLYDPENAEQIITSSFIDNISEFMYAEYVPIHSDDKEGEIIIHLPEKFENANQYDRFQQVLNIAMYNIKILALNFTGDIEANTGG